MERVGGRNLVTTAEIARYRAEVLGTRGWEERKADTTPPATGEGARTRQRAYRARKRTQASA